MGTHAAWAPIVFVSTSTDCASCAISSKCHALVQWRRDAMCFFRVRNLVVSRGLAAEFLEALMEKSSSCSSCPERRVAKCES